MKIRYGYSFVNHNESKGIILLLHGRAEFMEKYNHIAHKLNLKGYNVISFDWRGQGLSDRETEIRNKGHVNNFNDYLHDLKLLFEKIIQPLHENVFILSHSMGGHIGLRFLYNFPGLVEKAVFASPMFDIKTFLVSKLITRTLTQKACNAGFSEYFIIGGKKFDFTRSSIKKNILSHDFKKLSVQEEEINKNPDLAIGGATWGWLNAAFESIDIIMEKDYALNIKTPVLIVNAEKDKLVTEDGQKIISNRLYNGSYISMKNAFHEIMFEKKDIRDLFWKAFFNFIE